jgi:CheY-like chemotaxis protein
MRHASRAGMTGVGGDAHRCRSVLIVEDDDDIRMTLKDIIEDEGYPTATAANGQEALDELAHTERPPCLILLDLMMPVMNGSEFLSALRADDMLAPIPVVVVSAWAGEAHVTPGAQGFMRKPVDLSTLIEVIRRYC